MHNEVGWKLILKTHRGKYIFDSSISNRSIKYIRMHNSDSK